MMTRTGPENAAEGLLNDKHALILAFANSCLQYSLVGVWQ